MPSHTHYDNLKVSRTAPIEIIKASYRALLQKHPPDKNNNSAEATRITKIIIHAYELLSDPVKRAAYDEELKQEELKEQVNYQQHQTESSIPEKPTKQPEPSEYNFEKTPRQNTKFNTDNIKSSNLSDDITSCINTLKNFTCEGRASPQEFRIFIVVFLTINFIFGIIFTIYSDHSNLIDIIFWLFILVLTPSNTFLYIRRLHDIGRSGWWHFLYYFLYSIASLYYLKSHYLFLGIIYTIILMYLPSQIGSNIYNYKKYQELTFLRIFKLSFFTVLIFLLFLLVVLLCL